MEYKFNTIKPLLLTCSIAILFNGCFFSSPKFNLDNETIQLEECQKLQSKEKRINCYNDLSSDNSIAALKLGIFNADNKNYDKAFEYLSNSKEMGNYYANLPLAYLYFRGTGVEKDSQKSIELLEESAQKDANAAFQLSKFYAKGKTIAQNTTKALNYLTSAANKNMFIAQKELAIVYSKGLFDVEKDEIKAKYWQEKANNNKSDKTFDIYKL